ncbi:hypothetical protein MPTK1_6g16500 [Marchantia polymorpha subsp. ruderalis]|nr:hypothetical protein MARPO_0170s0026 [Marchantia polymorpha]BBN15044.1 hypothetical protein Mp_6g16500 [Marchantia polymorpha subsp. ruderalis]|eukprot:PTQ28222.1 hypothetical protein MARPO_0170s0026 [Marchantia polymorpha]
MGNGTKFKLSSMFPSVLSKIKGMTGKRLKGKGALTSPSDWSGDLQEFSGGSKDSPGSPPSPVRTFPQNRDRDMRYCSSPRCSSPVNHKSYDIRFPIESPVRRGMKSRPVSPPRRSANSINSDSGCCSFDSSLALMPHDRARRAVPPLFGRCMQRSKCNSFNSETHSDSELDVTDSEPASARGHLRARTMSMQLDGATEWERERDWSEPEKSASSSRRRRPREINKSTAGEPSPIHTVRCMPPNTPSDLGHFSDSRDHECHRSACPDFGRDMSDHGHGQGRQQQQYDRKMGFATEDTRLFEDTYASFSSDEDFFKVRSGGYNAIGQYRLKKLNKYGNGDVTDAGYASGDMVLTEDEERTLRRESVLAKTVRNASDGWARVQSRFAEEEKHAQGGRGGSRRSYDRRTVVAEEAEVLLTEDERHHAALCRREASLVKTVLSAKDWARENLRALSKASEGDKQQQVKGRGADSGAEYESFGLPVIHKEHLHSRGSTRSHSPIGEVEKHTKGRVDYKASANDPHDAAADRLVFEQFSQPLAEYASDFYKNAQTEESDFETGVVGVSVSVRPWDVEFPSFRSDSLQLGGSRRSAPVELSESEGPTPRTHRLSVQERTPSSKTPRKQTPSSREPPVKKAGRSASPKVQDPAPVNSLKPSSRSGSPRRQELHSGKRATSPRTPSSARAEPVASKKTSRSPSPRQEVAGKKQQQQQPSSNSTNSPSARQQQQQQVEVSSNGSSKKANRSASPAHSPPETEKRDSNARPSQKQHQPQPTRLPEERTSVMGSDSVAVVKASYDPYQDFRESMVEMILENDIQTAEDLEQLLQCYLSLNSAEYHSIIVQVFSDIWRDIFDH